MTTIDEIDRLNACGDIIWRNDRYGSTYAVDRPELLAQLAKITPLIQLGQSGAITAVVHATPGVRWYVVSLYCSRDVAAERMQYRGDINIDERLAAWDETVNVDRADLTVDTGAASPADVAVQIHSLV